MKQVESELWKKLKLVIDPGANLSVVDMGLIKERGPGRLSHRLV